MCHLGIERMMTSLDYTSSLVLFGYKPKNRVEAEGNETNSLGLVSVLLIVTVRLDSKHVLTVHQNKQKRSRNYIPFCGN